MPYTASDFRCPHCCATPHKPCKYKTGDEKQSFHCERLMLAKQAARSVNMRRRALLLEGPAAVAL